MKTADELWEECERVDQAFDRCQERLRLEKYKDAEYIRTCLACDVAFRRFLEAQEAEEGGV